MSKEFLLFLVNEQYGDTFHILLNAILSEPSQQLTLPQILKHTKAGYIKIRQLLILAIKNNLIKLDQQSQEQQIKHSKEKYEDKFVVNVQEILQIYRYPKFIDYASKHFGILESLIIQQMLLLQSSTIEQCINEISADIAQQISIIYFYFLLHRAILGDFNVGEIKVKFDNLIEKGFIKEAYLLNFSCISENNEVGDEQQKEEMIEEKVSMSKRKKVKLNEELITQMEKEMNRERCEQQNKSSIDQNTKIYKINYRQFIHEFRTQQIFNLIKFQSNIQAASILQFMLIRSKFIDQAIKFKATGQIFLQLF